MVRTLDKTHTVLSYIEGSLKNVMIVEGENKHQGFIFSLLNPPVPLGGNIVSLDIYVNEIPIPKKSIFIATSEDVVNAFSECKILNNKRRWIGRKKETQNCNFE
jgi:hypothetical protein